MILRALKPFSRIQLGVAATLIAGVPILTCALLAQTTISAGSIQGTVSDPSGAVVGGAKITITSRETGQVIHLGTTSAGIYASPALIPGNYIIDVEYTGFKKTEISVVVQVGVTSSANIKMQVGQATELVEVRGSEVLVNT